MVTPEPEFERSAVIVRANVAAPPLPPPAPAPPDAAPPVAEPPAPPSPPTAVTVAMVASTELLLDVKAAAPEPPAPACAEPPVADPPPPPAPPAPPAVVPVTPTENITVAPSGLSGTSFVMAPVAVLLTAIVDEALPPAPPAPAFPPNARSAGCISARAAGAAEKIYPITEHDVRIGNI